MKSANGNKKTKANLTEEIQKEIQAQTKDIELQKAKLKKSMKKMVSYLEKIIDLLRS